MSGLYRLSHMPVVPEQIRSVAAQAEEEGELASFINLLKMAEHRLTHNPIDWGDPSYHTKLAGGMVYRGIIRPVAFDYVVFAEERVVIVLKVGTYASFSDK